MFKIRVTKTHRLSVGHVGFAGDDPRVTLTAVPRLSVNRVLNDEGLIAEIALANYSSII